MHDETIDFEPNDTVQWKRSVVLDHSDDDFSELVIDNYSRRNALSANVLDAILAAVDECVDAGSRVLIIRGSNRFFSAGADVCELTGLVGDIEHDAKVAALIDVLTRAPLVSIAAVEGGCIGAGLELATACDIRIADETAFFAFPALEMGLLYRPTAIERTARLVGPAAAARMLLLGERLSLVDAYRCGLVTSMAERGCAAESARTLASRLCTAPPGALHASVRILSSVVSDTSDPAMWTDQHLKSFASLSRFEAVETKKKALRKRER
jgi:enoyl-CoA hydratase/carnithine racemase